MSGALSGMLMTTQNLPTMQSRATSFKLPSKILAVLKFYKNMLPQVTKEIDIRFQETSEPYWNIAK
jgi:hypothetical protein